MSNGPFTQHLLVVMYRNRNGDLSDQTTYMADSLEHGYHIGMSILVQYVHERSDMFTKQQRHVIATLVQRGLGSFTFRSLPPEIPLEFHFSSADSPPATLSEPFMKRLAAGWMAEELLDV
jgi:hypothetical protein